MVLDPTEIRKILADLDLQDETVSILVESLEEVAFGVVNALFEEIHTNDKPQ